MRRAKPDFSSSPTPTSDWLTTPEVAALLRVHPKHVYRLLHQGMPARRVGGQWRFSREAIKQWADQRGEALCAEGEPSHASLATASVPLIAVESNDVCEAVVESLTIASGVRLATMTGCALEMLGSGEVVAAIVRGGEDSKTDCATVRISLGSRRLGLLSHQGGVPARGARIAVPSSMVPVERLALAQRKAVKIKCVPSELDACTAVVRGETDAALGSEAWSRSLGLEFDCLSTEPWELAVRVDAMEDPSVSRVCVAAQGDVVRARLGAVLSDAAERGGQMRLESGVQSGPAQSVAADDELESREAPERSRRTVRWTILTRDRADQMLQLVDNLRTRGVRVGGFVQVPSGPASAKPLGYDLYRLSQPERIQVAERILHDQRRPTGERYCELTFHTEALARACEWLREDVTASDVLIVDGVGRLEERGQGLFSALAWARMQARPKVIVLSSRRDHIPRIAERLALSDRLVTELSFDNDAEAPTSIVDHILRGCGKTRRARGQSTEAE